jgi:hypothetical protein
MDDAGASTELTAAAAQLARLYGASKLAAAVDAAEATAAPDGDRAHRLCTQVLREIESNSARGLAAAQPARRILGLCDELLAPAAAATADDAVPSTPRDTAAAAPSDAEARVRRAVCDYGTAYASVLLCSALQDAASAGAASLAPHVAYWRQREGPGSVLLALLGPLRRGVLTHRSGAAAALVADAIEAGPVQWARGAWWAGAEGGKRVLAALVYTYDARPLRRAALAALHAAREGLRYWLRRGLAALHAGYPRSAAAVIPRWLAAFAATPPAPRPQSGHEQREASPSPQHAVLPRWLQPSPLPPSLRSPSHKAAALSVLQAPLHTLAGAASECLTAVAAAAPTGGGAAVVHAALTGPDSLLLRALLLGRDADSASAAAVADAVDAVDGGGGGGGGGDSGRAATVRRLLDATDRVSALPALLAAVAAPYRGRPALQRNWLLLAGVAGGLYVGARQLAANRDAAAAWARESADGVAGFYREHLRTPLSRMAGELFGTAPVPHVADADALELARGSLAGMLADYHARLAARPGRLPPDLRGADLAALAAQLDMRAVTDEFTRQVATPVASAVTGDLFELMLIQIAFLKKELLAASAALDTVMVENRFNLQAMAVVPALLVLGGSARAAGALYRAATAPLDTGDLRGRLRLLLHDAHRLLTLAGGSGSSGGGSAEAAWPAVRLHDLLTPRVERDLRGLWASLLPPQLGVVAGGGDSVAVVTPVPSPLPSPVPSPAPSPQQQREPPHAGAASGGLTLEQRGTLVSLQRELTAALAAYRAAARSPPSWDAWQRLMADVQVRRLGGGRGGTGGSHSVEPGNVNSTSLPFPIRRARTHRRTWETAR